MGGFLCQTSRDEMVFFMHVCAVSFGAIEGIVCDLIILLVFRKHLEVHSVL
jgi:hypothetical protein